MTGLLEQESKQGQKEGGQQKTEKNKKINKSVDQAEGMLHLLDIIKTQASDDKEWECHIHLTVL